MRSPEKYQQLRTFSRADKDYKVYINLHPNQAGVIQSQLFPGFWLDQSALLAGDMQQVLSVLQAGVNSVEHQAFVQQLAQRV
ncbi:hypothetical protein [Nostoc sp.]|uniref:hypothetical protein n=1 Tax=Nostoc sp. TaxID=1180 RepID=UPI002FFC578A